MDLQIAPFRFDVTPPLGHSLCGGWIPPVSSVDDPLEAIGFVLLGSGRPLVLCAVDWTGLCNEAHVAWRTGLAKAADTTAERVAVQCVHQHDAPFACLEAERIVQAQGDLPHIIDVEFFNQCLKRGQLAVQEALKRPRRITHVGSSQTKVEQVASNRRILGPDGKVRTNRSVAPTSDDVRDLPAGVIDAWLKTVAFYSGRARVVACHYYAVHPISYCCQEGRVSSEFVGLARRLSQEHDEPGCSHIYFTGCAGNLNTGKYNNSAVKENRHLLTERMFDAIQAAQRSLQPEPIRKVNWRTQEILPTPRNVFDQKTLEQQIADRTKRVTQRNRPAFTLAWLRRIARKTPIILSALNVNNISLLHLPGEPFVEYQLRAQALNPDRFVATAGYGDGGPWYIPTAEAYAQDGYEVRMAFCDSHIDPLLTQSLLSLLST